MEWYQTVDLVIEWIVELLDVIISWPLAIIISLLVFHKPLSLLIKRIKGIESKGTKLDFDVTPQVKKAESTQKFDIELEDKSKKDAIEDLMKFVPKSVSEQEELIKKELKEKELETQGKTVEFLIRLLAASSIVNNFWYIYNLIFGSQIFLLKIINQNRGTGFSKKDFNIWYSDLISKEFTTPIHEWESGRYLVFLLNAKLILENNNTLFITEKGVSFLEWIIKMGLSENRPL